MTEPRTLNLILDLPPSANNYWGTKVITSKKTGKPIAATFTTNDAAKYKKLIERRFEFRRPMLNDCSITVRVFRQAKRGDLDNFLKVLFDALKGIAYIDDKQIVEIHATLDDDKYRPRVEVEIREVNALGELFPAEVESEIPF